MDTCSFIWLTSAPDRLGAKARDALDAEQAEILLSDVSIWEICTKWQARKLELPAPPRVWIEEQASLWQLGRLPITQRSVIDPQNCRSCTAIHLTGCWYRKRWMTA